MESINCNKVNVNKVLLEIETLQTNVCDVRNIVQLLEMSLTENQDDKHIIRSIKIIDKMVRTIEVEDIGRLKDLLLHNSTE